MFIHGLRRVGKPVWMSSGQPPELWPLWLSDDIARLGIWSVEYDAAMTLWRGYSMSRADRANNILALLLSEERLKQGDLAFVTHSFGGLVFEHVVRIATERAPNHPNIADFLNRISRVTFLGTPHRGADLATLVGRLGLILRPSASTEGLRRNDPDLRDLNQFYRGFASRHGIDTQCLVETRPNRLLGMIVKPDSSDVGLEVAPIPIDADHSEIASPAAKNSEVYIHVRDQLKKPVRARKLVIEDPSALGDIAKHTIKNSAALERIEQRLSSADQKARVPSALVDAETRKRLMRLRRMRFFVGTTHLEGASRLAQELLHGELCETSPNEKAIALAWCARMLLAKPDRSEALQVLSEARKLAKNNEVTIAEAFAASYDKNTSGALGILAGLNSDEARAASFIVVSNARDSQSPLDWLERAGLSASNLSPDGKLFVLEKLFDAAKWLEALKVGNGLTEADYEQTPVLLYISASANLLPSVPEELRSVVRWQLPFDAAPFPLADDAASVAGRRTARELYERAAAAAKDLGCLRASHDASDRALWLGLRDPLHHAAARSELERSMRDPMHALRRLPLALQYGLKLDLLAVEREIDKQDALSDGNSPDAAVARLGMALTKKNPRDISDYVAKHRARLLKHLNPAFIATVEIQALAQSGQIELAEARVHELPADVLNQHERNRLLRFLEEARGANPIEAREAQFKRSDALTDLGNLIDHLEATKDWPRLVHYGRMFFERTHDRAAFRIYSQALFETGDFRGAVEVLGRNLELVEQSRDLEFIRAWSLFKLGDVKACRSVLDKLRAKRDDANDRILQIQLSIASGDWTSLGAFVEQEWNRRGDRTALELLRSSQLAHQLGSARVRELILEAAAKANDDPEILMGCYSTAITAGWEDEQTTGWLTRAAELSGEDGPIRRMSLREVFELHPKWQQRESQTWEQLTAGELPTFAAAHLLNRTLVELFMIPTISNRETTDPRKRARIYAFSGARRLFRGSAKVGAFDPTALLSLGGLNAIDKAMAYFEKIVVPHSTLGWLFEEKQRITFHQPSKMVEAREIKRLLDQKLLHKLEPTAPTNRDLASEIGDDLASLFAAAEADFGDDRRQRLVVRSSPVHRIGSLMEEEADLGEHAERVCSCLDVVAALARQGQLTKAEEQRARSYLALREKPWPVAPTIEPGAVLYLDDLSVSYLQHLRLLGKIGPAGFSGIVPLGELAQGDSLVRYEELSARANAIIEDVRRALAGGLESGKVVLAPSTKERGEEPDSRLQYHPCFEIVETLPLADVVVVDDRHFNQHGSIQGPHGATPIWTTYDFLALASDDAAQFGEIITSMRRSGYCFVPLRTDELRELISSASVANGALVESAELKAVRESLLLARISNGLQWPKERIWLDSVMAAFVQTIKAQWHDGMDEVVAKARSDWLLEQFDIRHWSQRFSPEGQSDIGSERYRGQVLGLSMLNTVASRQTKQKYWQWFEARVLAPIRDEDRDLYAAVVDQARSVIKEAAERFRGGDGDGEHST